MAEEEAVLASPNAPAAYPLMPPGRSAESAAGRSISSSRSIPAAGGGGGGGGGPKAVSLDVIQQQIANLNRLRAPLSARAGASFNDVDRDHDGVVDCDEAGRGGPRRNDVVPTTATEEERPNNTASLSPVPSSLVGPFQLYDTSAPAGPRPAGNSGGGGKKKLAVRGMDKAGAWKRNKASEKDGDKRESYAAKHDAKLSREEAEKREAAKHARQVAAKRWRESEEQAAQQEEAWARQQAEQEHHTALGRKVNLLHSIAKQASEALEASVKQSHGIRSQWERGQKEKHGHLQRLHTTVMAQIAKTKLALSGSVEQLKQLRHREVGCRAERERKVVEAAPVLTAAVEELRLLERKVLEGDATLCPYMVITAF